MPEVVTDFDVIVVGGGINGLTAAAYLAKSGLSTAVVERRDQIGTHCSTEELKVPGWKNNPHASGIWTGHSPCMMDLELEKHGLELIHPRFSRAQPFQDGTAFVPDLYDSNRTYKKWQRFNEHDAEIYKDIMNRFVEIRTELVDTFVFSPPSPENWERTVELFKSIPHIPKDFLEMTGFELLDLLFEDERLKAQMAGWSHAIAFEPEHKQIGPMGAIMLVSSFGVQQCLDGSHQIPHSLFRCIVFNGGKVLQNCTVEDIIIEDGTATGVRLSEYSSYPNRVLQANEAVISNLSVWPTWLDLIGEEHLDDRWVHTIKQFDYESTGVLYTACFLAEEPPDWVGSDFDPDIEDAWHFNFGVESLQDVEDCFNDLSVDRMPEPLTFLAANFNFSLHDSKAAPGDKYNIQLWADVPFNLRRKGGPEIWDEINEEVLHRCRDRINEYAPGFAEDGNIVDEVGYTPLDVARRNQSAVKGVWASGVHKPGQFYLDRPFVECNPPRTPFENLYLSNGVWPVSFSWLGAGYNAAQVVMEDLGLEKPSWWRHKPGDWFDLYAERNNLDIQKKVTL